MISIGKLVYNILSNTPNLVNGRVFPLISPENTQLPFIIYDRESVNPVYTKDGVSGNLTTVAVYVLASDYNTSVELAEKVRSSLENLRFNYAGVNVYDSELSSADESWNEYSFIQQLTFTFKTN